MISMFNNQVMLTMERYLDLAAQRHKVISGNLANIDTPNFRALDIPIESTMRSLLASTTLEIRATAARHFGQEKSMLEEADVIEVEGQPLRNDLNNVDLDHEMLKMGQNSLQFSLFAQLLKAKFRLLQQTINEGRF